MIKGFVWETVLTCIALVLLPYLIIRLAHYLQKHARPYLLCVKWVVLAAGIVLFT